MPREEFGKEVRRLLYERGLGVKAAAAKAGIAHTTVIRMSRGLPTRISTLHAWAAAFGEPVGKWLVLAGYDSVSSDTTATPQIRPLAGDSGASARGQVNLAAPAVPDAVRAAIAAAETRQEKVSIAFAYLCRPELDLRLGADAMTRQTTDAQLAIVRVYERLTGVTLLPPEVV